MKQNNLIKETKNNQLKYLLHSLVPIQALAVGLPAINTLLNGFVVGHYLGSSALAAIGFAGPLTYLFQMISCTLANGSQILSGHKLGSGDKGGLLRTFNSTCICAAVIGALVSVLLLVFCKGITLLLGTSADLMEMTGGYIMGLAPGVLLSVMFTVLLSFLQLERASKTSTAAIVVLLIVNTGFNFLNIYTLHGGLFGAALSTSVANLFAVLICVIYLICKSSMFRFSPGMFDMKTLKEVLHLGVPSIVSPACGFARDRILNQIIFAVGGTTAMAAMALTMNIINGIGATINGGFSNAAKLMVSVLAGERDVESLRTFSKTLIKSMFPVMAIAYVLIFAFAHPLALVFGAELEKIGTYVMVIRFCCFYFITNSFTVPTINIYQTMGRVKLVSFIFVLNILVLPVITALVGSFVGLWLIVSFSWIAELGVIAVFIIYYYMRRKKLPSSIFRITDIPNTIAVPSRDRCSTTITKISEAIDASEKVEAFCSSKGMSLKTSRMCGLCVEEMAVDCIIHGFIRGKKNRYSIELRAIYEDNSISLMLRNNCPHFDPEEWLALYSTQDSDRSIGLHLAAACAKEMNYSYTLGLNVITIRMEEAK